MTEKRQCGLVPFHFAQLFLDFAESPEDYVALTSIFFRYTLTREFDENDPDCKIYIKAIAKNMIRELEIIYENGDKKRKKLSENGRSGGIASGEKRAEPKQNEANRSKSKQIEANRSKSKQIEANVKQNEANRSIEIEIERDIERDIEREREREEKENNLVGVEAKKPPLKRVKQAELLKKAQEVGDFLNAERGRKQIKYVDSSLKNVMWVLKNGFSVEDCKAVLRWMLYGKNSYYRDNGYIDLNTPFRQEKFQRNLQNAIAEGFEPAGSDGVISDGKYPVDDDLVEGVDFFWDIERTLPDEEKIKATRFPEYYKIVPKCRISMVDFCELPDKNRRYFDGRLDNSAKNE